MSPSLLLGAVLALIGAQVTRVAAPHRLGYAAALGLAVAGVLAAEVVARLLHSAGPVLGSLHPVADVVGIAAAEVVGALLRRPAGTHHAA